MSLWVKELWHRTDGRRSDFAGQWIAPRLFLQGCLGLKGIFGLIVREPCVCVGDEQSA